MAEQFYTILTQSGKAKIANASMLGNKVNFTDFALGDGGGKYYNPTENQIELKNEVWRGKIGQIVVDEKNSNWIIIEAIIPADQGGFMIREAGIFDDEGNLLAIGKYPETYKPLITDGGAKDLYIRMILEVANTSVVNLKVDPTVILATKKDIDEVKKEVNEKTSNITAENIKLSDGKTVEERFIEVDTGIEQLFQSGLDGKNLLETSIKSKGGMVSKQSEVATFSELDVGIKSIITDPSIGTTDATVSDILLGKKVVSQGNLLTGTMPDNGAVNKILTKDVETYTIPGGYHDGNGIVKTNITGLTPYNIRYGAVVGGVRGGFIGNQFKFIRFYNSEPTLSSHICSYINDKVSVGETKDIYVSLGFRPDEVIVSRVVTNYMYNTSFTSSTVKTTSTWTGRVSIGDEYHDREAYLTKIQINSNGVTFTIEHNKYDKYDSQIYMDAFAYKLGS